MFLIKLDCFVFFSFYRFFLIGIIFFGQSFCFAFSPNLTNVNPVNINSERESRAYLCEIKNLIPNYIWQTYKTKTLPQLARKCQKTWLKNSTFKYHLFDDMDIELYILNNWDPLYLSFFHSLPLGVMKADLWRYMIIATEGGVYSDIDSKCLTSLKKWSISVCSTDKHILVLGLENDSDFCQWTFAATKNHPAMHFVCQFLLQNWMKNGINISDPHFVHATTGPSIWTSALKHYLSIDPSFCAGDIFNQYTNDSAFRNLVNDKGIWILSKDIFSGTWSCNLYGSQIFNDGYVKWIDERDGLIK